MDNTTNFTNSTNGTFEGFASNGTPKSFWSGLLLPVLYLTILIGSLATFSSLYRRRQIAKAAQLESWFPPHRARDIYLSLLHIDPAEASSESEQKITQVPDSLLKAALLRRALEDIRRIVQLRGSKQALQNLVQRGSVGDELWQRFQRAEQEMEAEVKDVAQEVRRTSSTAFSNPLYGKTRMACHLFSQANTDQNLFFLHRRKRSFPAGARSSSNRPTNSTSTTCSASGFSN
jgi:translocation protein SEC66